MGPLQRVPESVRPTSWKTVLAALPPAAITGLILVVYLNTRPPITWIVLGTIAIVCVIYLSGEPSASASFGLGAYLVAVALVFAPIGLIFGPGFDAFSGTSIVILSVLALFGAGGCAGIGLLSRQISAR
ncbi:hypothetical protein Hbl1158_10185 [Halobaculum sp. CBA1158]|uniref:hypothetical protein n=1 Tax=Halobaculum sp. CBA1158 TaxID=2904243 RepID=UPI001F2DF271|nr:hypothetical protein [Halobaculum sp. CBA1158]UIO98902.1 hypothetical protein Hbl1158_10185 [Halobaculum sp. CBA1158]